MGAPNCNAASRAGLSSSRKSWRNQTRIGETELELDTRALLIRKMTVRNMAQFEDLARRFLSQPNEVEKTTKKAAKQRFQRPFEVG
jgi:hypothetical protein